MTPIKIIAELGINHDGSEARARELIDAAATARIWGVKFQYRNLKNAYATDARQIGDEILKDEIVKTYLAPAKIVSLVRHAHDLGLAAGISFFVPEDMGDFGSEIENFDFFKIPSVEFTHKALADAFAATGKPGLISTGAYAEPAIRSVLNRLDRAIWTPLHCISNYPVAITNPRLGYIDHLRHLWGAPVGYSSHDDNWEMCLLAMQKGACVIERH
ncbi:MAG: N-acetylneuraminate synthase family protein, partial [Rhodobacteraceae bacterium]|nr:N-acetylneuraminate synthase family protein [Paracoccaceae bacterium]